MKSILTIILVTTVVVLSAQTASITLSDDDKVYKNWTELQSSNSPLALVNQNQLEQLKIEFGVGEEKNLRTIETHSETWILRDKDNLNIQLDKRTASQRSNSSQDAHDVIVMEYVDMKIKTIEVYDILGRVVHASTFDDEVNRIHLDHFSDGIYYLVLRDKNKKPQYSQKLALK